MRLCRLLVFLLIAVASAGCAGVPGPVPELAVPAPDAPPPADLDGFILSRRAGYAAPVPVPVAAPPAAVSPFGGPISVPVGAPLPVPASVVPGPAPGNNGLPYTLDSGDRLRIVVFGQEGLSNIYTVDVSGKIAMPLIGVVSARGCTTAQLARLISDRLRQGYIREPHVAVEVEIYRPFFILGEVIAPGQYPYVPNMTIETAVAIAGGFTPRAYRYDVEVSRSADGVTSRQKVPMIAPVRPGDTINVSERWF